MGSGLGQEPGSPTHSILGEPCRCRAPQRGTGVLSPADTYAFCMPVSACDNARSTQECVMTQTAYLVTVFPLGHISPRAGSMNTQIIADFSPGTAGLQTSL